MIAQIPTTRQSSQIAFIQILPALQIVKQLGAITQYPLTGEISVTERTAPGSWPARDKAMVQPMECPTR